MHRGVVYQHRDEKLFVDASGNFPLISRRSIYFVQFLGRVNSIGLLIEKPLHRIEIGSRGGKYNDIIPDILVDI
jgi:hypothetical protein